jgi:hypothetical protein
MSATSATNTMLERLGFSYSVAAYLSKDCGIDSLHEIAYLDGDHDMENTIKGVTSLGVTVTFGTVTKAMISRHNGIPVSIRAVANLNICVYYIKHMERVQRKPMVTAIDLELVRSYRAKQRYEASFKKTLE